MTREELCQKLNDAIAAFTVEGTPISCNLYGSGHINDTHLLITKKDDCTECRYILQRINHVVFPHPDEVMENILNVTRHLAKGIAARGGDVTRETLTVVPTKDGLPYYRDEIGCYWRTYLFVEDNLSLDKVETPEQFYQSAVAFGRFQNQLSDFPADTLHEAIVNFHNTPVRYENLMRAVAADKVGRAAECAAEIAFAEERREFCGTLYRANAEGKLPLRVTHNDTKLNNILFDAKTKEPLCVIDLDTIMPGFSVNDFGDSIRFGATTAAEDETDLSKVMIDLSLFETFARGFIEGCDGRLTDTEIALLPAGAKMMTLECGMRFLTDYLEGDTYFRIHREKHNLDRARNQFRLVASMEEHWDEMCAIVARLAAK
ncbi:MAG: aminoglycoside phosphotransferase family protein [Clostridia bacterium]|nr:aminoglycoside phosphotransferase family protein [Clostridia bacterium]